MADPGRGALQHLASTSGRSWAAFFRRIAIRISVSGELEVGQQAPLEPGLHPIVECGQILDLRSDLTTHMAAVVKAAAEAERERDRAELQAIGDRNRAAVADLAACPSKRAAPV